MLKDSFRFLVCHEERSKDVLHGNGKIRKQQNTFDKSKELFTSSNLLIYFSPSLPILLGYDASNYGIGAALAHQMLDRSECLMTPIIYALRSRSTEVNKDKFIKSNNTQNNSFYNSVMLCLQAMLCLQVIMPQLHYYITS